jgi:hypothetical protein
MRQDDALEVAKLAAAVGGQLKKIDQYTSDRTNNPANKIDINRFIQVVKDPRASTPVARYLNDVPHGFAPPPPEDYIQSVVPDATIGSSLQTTIAPQFNLNTVPVTTAPSLPQEQLKPLQTAPSLPQEQLKPIPTVTNIPQKQEESLKEDSLKEISKTLKSINKNISSLVSYFLENKKINE